MEKVELSRRQFVKSLAGTGAAVMFGTLAAQAEPDRGKRMYLACNQYPWIVYYRREGRDFGASLDQGFADVAASGIDGFEPIINGPQDIDRLEPLLRKHRLQMRSLYVNSVLHDPEQAPRSIDHIIEIARRAKRLGTQIIVTNPSPIRWGGQQDKNDSQLRLQAESLERLGRRLSAMGMILAYHNHDVELRQAAREFHHMMVGTDPKYVTLCLDAHWIYRGSGNSTVALFDVLKLYGRRVSELHLRQSKQGIWSEVFEDGDIDYAALAKYLAETGVRPHLVLEQAVESGTPKTMGTVEAFRRSCAYARKVFAVLQGPGK